MNENNKGSCGLIVGFIIVALIINYFGLKNVITFIIDSILIMLLIPAVLGVLYFIFKK
jgi:hypothetical protein